MKRSEAFPSKYLGKDDVEGTITATIDDVWKETIKGDRGEEDKAVMSFRERDLKPLILNNINWMTIEDKHGDESDNWKGVKVEIYVDPSVMFGNKRVGGVRLRLPNGSDTTGSQTGWSLDQAVAECAKVKIDKEEMIAHLKENGESGWNSARCTPIIQKLIEDSAIPF